MYERRGGLGDPQSEEPVGGGMRLRGGQGPASRTPGLTPQSGRESRSKHGPAVDEIAKEIGDRSERVNCADSESPLSTSASPWPPLSPFPSLLTPLCMAAPCRGEAGGFECARGDQAHACAGGAREWAQLYSPLASPRRRASSSSHLRPCPLLRSLSRTRAERWSGNSSVCIRAKAPRS